MKLLIAAVFLTAIPGIKKNRGDILPREFTQAVSGLCACLIMLSHSLYSFDALYAFSAYPGQVFLLDQLVVAPFLFFSGYGLVLSARSKPRYIENLPKKKMLPLYLRFAAFNTLSVALACALKTGFRTGALLKSFFCLDTVLMGRLGSCSWFVAVLLLLWGAAYLSFRLFRGREKQALIMASILSAEIYIFLRVAGLPSPWWDTLLVFPLGLWTAYFSKPLGEVLRRNTLLNTELILTFALLLILNEMGFRRTGTARAFFTAPLFLCAGMTVLSARFTAGNRFLRWCGRRALYLYLVQEPVLRLLQQLEAAPEGFLRKTFPSLFDLYGRINVYVYIAIAILFIFAAAECFAQLWKLAERGAAALWKKRKRSV